VDGAAGAGLGAGVTKAVAGGGCEIGAAGFTAGAGDGAGAVGAGVGGVVGVVADTVGLAAGVGFGEVGVEGVGVEEVASTFGGVVVSALASSGCGARAVCAGCGSGSPAYFA
jgi:hypothetical protein